LESRELESWRVGELESWRGGEVESKNKRFLRSNGIIQETRLSGRREKKMRTGEEERKRCEEVS
jgi:hypothetical protein